MTQSAVNTDKLTSYNNFNVSVIYRAEMVLPW